MGELRIAMQSSKAAHEAMGAAIACLHELDRDQQRHLQEEALLVEFVHRTIITCFNTITFLMARDRPGIHHEGVDIRPLVEIATDELENARHARALYTGAPWLDLGFRLEGRFPSSLEMLAAKEKILIALIGT